MAENEANSAPAADAAALSDHLTGPTAGPLVVSETNPRYFAVAAGDEDDRGRRASTMWIRRCRIAAGTQTRP